MKHTFFLIILILTFGKIFGQTERYVYETQVNPDTINLVSMMRERTFLDINKGHSTFVSENKLLKDSLISVFKKQQENSPSADKKKKKGKTDFPKLADGQSLQPSFFDFFIEKNVANKEVSLIENVGTKQIYYLEDRKIHWNISNEITDFNGYKIQKATTNFGGRIWTVWFAPDIKISDGPYKFYGLPGLILKLEDETGDYKFAFLKKINIRDSYTESLSPDAKKSTRLGFIGDKAATELEFAQKKGNSSRNYSGFGGSGRNGGGKGGMHGGGMGGGGKQGGMNEDGGMQNQGMGSENQGERGFSQTGFGGENQNLNQTKNNGNFQNISDGNPIELNK